MRKKRSRRVHYNVSFEGVGHPSLCRYKRVLTTKNLKKVTCVSCLGLLIDRSKGDRKRQMERQLKVL